MIGVSASVLEGPWPRSSSSKASTSAQTRLVQKALEAAGAPRSTPQDGAVLQHTGLSGRGTCTAPQQQAWALAACQDAQEAKAGSRGPSQRHVHELCQVIRSSPLGLCNRTTAASLVATAGARGAVLGDPKKACNKGQCALLCMPTDYAQHVHAWAPVTLCRSLCFACICVNTKSWLSGSARPAPLLLRQEFTIFLRYRCGCKSALTTPAQGHSV